MKAFAQAGGELAGQEPLQIYERLMAETSGPQREVTVKWSATGEQRPVQGAADQVWLHLQAEARLPLICQRCLGPVEVTVVVDRSFRFVADEDTAAAQDDEAEEDLLALSQDFNVAELIEDELLMEMPTVPRHESCPSEVKLVVTDEDFEAESAAQPNPFAVLQKLKTDKGN